MIIYFLYFSPFLSCFCNLYGWIQILKLADSLKRDDFILKRGIELVAHSPLKRAKQTSEGMLGCCVDKEDGIKIAKGVKRVLEIPCLSERTPLEWLPNYHDAYIQRISTFEQWLSQQPEQVIAIVGHSQYFKTMLNMSFKFKNCDVWQITFDPNHLHLHHPNNNTATAAPNTQKSKSSENDPFYFEELPRGWSHLKRLYTY